MHKTQKTTADNKFTRPIHALCALGATAVTAGSGYGVTHTTIQQRISAMLAYVVVCPEAFRMVNAPRRRDALRIANTAVLISV